MSTKHEPTTTATRPTHKVTVTWRETAEYSFEVSIPSDLTSPAAIEAWLDDHLNDWTDQIPKKVWLGPLAVYDREIVNVDLPPVAPVLFG